MISARDCEVVIRVTLWTREASILYRKIKIRMFLLNLQLVCDLSFQTIELS